MFKLSRRQALIAGSVSPLLAREALADTKPINEDVFVHIGGIEQFVALRGKNPHAPIVLFLHGGPGEAMSPFLDIFAPYEEDFTWAIWDQRGSGKTYGRYDEKTPGMDREQFVQDTIELATHLRNRFHKRKIVLLGQSWGAALGLQVAQRRPDLFYAFVGSGQAVSNELGLLSQERYARKVFAESNDVEGLKTLDEVSKLPSIDPKRRFAVRKILFGPEDKKFLSREDAFMGPKPWPKTGPVADWINGYTFTSNVLVPKIIGKEEIDIVGYSIPLPYVVVQGVDDHITPTDVAREYVEKCKAPIKAFVEIPGGHFCCYTNQPDFLKTLRQHVLPIARH